MEKRFVKVYSDGMMNISEIWVDIKTGVNYFYHASGNSGGLTPLRFKYIQTGGYYGKGKDSESSKSGESAGKQRPRFCQKRGRLLGFNDKI